MPPRRRVFLALWHVLPDGEGFPFGLETRYGYLVFVFVEPSRLDELRKGTIWPE